MGVLNLFKKKAQDKDSQKPQPTKEVEKVVKEVKEKDKSDKNDQQAVKTKKDEPKKASSSQKDKDQKSKKVVKPTKPKSEIKGKSQEAYRTLVRPVVTEKAADLGVYGKYIFVVDKTMNKIEIKKAIRTIYGVDPIRINVTNVAGKKIRYGRVWGRTKDWKKAVITLKPGDKIEVYEGV